MKTDFIIVGNNIAAMISALELGKNGHNVVLINPQPSWGAHFGGFHSRFGEFDLGMNLIEFTSYNSRSSGDDPMTYNPTIRNDVGRFTANIERYVKLHLDCIDVPTPKMFFNGTYSDDITISNQFEVLKHLSLVDRENIKRELMEILSQPEHELHASRKIVQQSLFLEKSYEEVSLANHGPTFHRIFVEPLCRRILNLSSDRILGLYHRVPWGPLFYPETLLSQFSVDPQILPQTKFSYPANGYLGSLVEVLLRKIQNHERIEVIQGQLDTLNIKNEIQVQLKSRVHRTANHLVWALDLNTFFKVTEEYKDEYNYERASAAILFFKVPQADLLQKFSTLCLMDESLDVYRITNQTVCSGRDESEHMLNAEFVFDRLPQYQSERDVVRGAEEIFKKIGLIAPRTQLEAWEFKRIKDVLVCPTRSNYLNFVKMKDRAEDKYGKYVDFLAQSSAFLVASLNDNIIQGLKVAKKFPITEVKEHSL